MSEKGTISIHAQNIMPIIKRWLYSDKDIFLRELISNACDAIAKYKFLAQNGDARAEENPRIDVILDEANKTIQIVDNGIGMTADEVKRFIAQVAFSGAEEFLQKYKADDQESGIIGHFGLGFYSAFMVSSRVQIDTLSHQDGAEAVRWISLDGMEYDMEPSDRAQRGTTITLTISDDEHEFLHRHAVEGVLNKYCAFMPVPIFLSEVSDKVSEETPDEVSDKPEQPESGDAASKDEGAPEQVNETTPLWMKKPSEVTDDEYKAFYRKVFNDFNEPLFWIHLNAEYPFNLKGILYFPRLKNDFRADEGVIKLYSNQVFVADNIKEVIPEFLMLLKGAIDCPELPLNVSRSFLQNDGYVKKMQAYITRKVADRLASEFANKREDYEKYWDDIHPFIKYGCIKDDKFYERVKDCLLFKTTDGRFVTTSEYKEKNGDTVYYTADEKRQAHLVALYVQQGKDVAVMNTVIDNNFISFLEYQAKDSAIKFQRVDSGLEGLTEEGDQPTDEEAAKALQEKFKRATGDEQLTIKLESLKSDELPAILTVDEQSRRFSEMSRMWSGGAGFEMPQPKTLALNAKHPLVKHLLTSADEALDDALCAQILDLAEMAREPLSGDRMVAFLKRSNDLLTKLV